jgi:hypothetical protein
VPATALAVAATSSSSSSAAAPVPPVVTPLETRDFANLVRQVESAGNLQAKLQQVLMGLGLPPEALPAALASLAAFTENNRQHPASTVLNTN